MTREQKCAVAIALLANFVAPFMTSGLNLAINDIGTYFSCSAGISTWIVNAYTLATAVFSIPLGHLADIKGRRLMIMVGSLIFAACGVFCMLATSPWLLIIGRFAMGVAAGVFLGAGTPLMLQYFQPQHAGRYIGLAIAAVGIGVAAGPVVGGIMNSALGWRSVFVPSIVIAVATALLCLGVSKDQLSADVPANDLLGNVLFVAGLGACMVGVGTLDSFALAPALIVAGLVLVVVFCAYSAKRPNPVVQVRLFAGNPVYSLANLACMANFMAGYSVTYVIAIHVQNVYGLSSAFAGVVMMSQPLIQTIVAPVAGRLSERIESNLLSGIGMIGVAAGLLILCFLTPELPLWVVVAGLVVIGLGTALFGSPNTNAILACVGPESKSEANATASGMRGIGQCLALALVGFLYSLGIGDAVFSQAAPAALCAADATIMRFGFFFAAFAAVCCFIAYAIQRKRGA